MGRNPHRVRLPWKVAAHLKAIPGRIGFGALPEFGPCASPSILTTYFSSKRDPQRRVRQAKDSFDYMRPWYESMVERGLHGRVFHDGLGPAFTSRYETDRLQFTAISPWYPNSTNDHRFWVYDRFLESYTAPGVFMTDLSDIRIACDPFPRIDGERLHVGDDCLTLKDNAWLRALAEATGGRRYLDWLDSLGEQPSLNAGVIGGPTPLVRELIREMLVEFERIAKPWLNANMLVFNYVLHRLFTGRFSMALCSRYKKFETHRTDVPFIHK